MRGEREDVQPRRPSANIQLVATDCEAPIVTPSFVTVAIWNCPSSALSHAKQGTVKTDLVQTPRIAIEEHPHRILDRLPCQLLVHLLPTVWTELLERATEQRLCEMVPIPRRQRRGGVGRSEQIDIGQESTTVASVQLNSQWERTDGSPCSIPATRNAFQKGSCLVRLSYMTLLRNS